jgi:hypothetical protein
MSTLSKYILFVGRTSTGRDRDYTMLKQELPPDEPWFDGLQVLVALGYLGMPKGYDSDNISLPFKKPRKSKKNPNPQLTDDQKAAKIITRGGGVYAGDRSDKSPSP